MKNKIKVLFFANIPVKKSKDSLGGALVLAKEILDYLKQQKNIEVSHKQIRTFWKHKLQLIDYFIWIFRFPFYIKNFDVISIHATQDFHFTIAPILCFWVKLFNKKLVYHIFGGEFHEQYDRLPSFIQYIIRKTILSADTVFIETKLVIEYFNKYDNINIVWLPNSRKANTVVSFVDYAKKFAFISRVIPEKGMDTIITASKRLKNDIVIDVFGPKNFNYNIESKNNNIINYKGALEPTEVLPTLQQYNILLLPTYFKGEGYPGVIIEALSLGKPVITTYWKSIPEIITNNYNGKLIDVKNSNSLVNAINYFNKNNYNRYSNNALKSFDNFNSDIVFDKIVKSYLC